MKTKNITKNWLIKEDACEQGVTWFLNQRQRDEIKVIQALIKEERLDWASWTIVRRMAYKQYVKYAVYAAKQVLRIYENECSGGRLRKTIEAAELCIKNPSKKNKAAAAYAYAASDAEGADIVAEAAAYACDAGACAAEAAAYTSDNAAADAAFYADNAANASRNMQLKILKHGIKILKGTA